MRNVLVHIHPDDGQEARLAAAIAIVRAFGGHLTAVQVTPYSTYIAADPFGGTHLVAAALARQEENEREELGRLQERMRSEGVPFDWIHVDGEPARALVRASRLVDLVVLSRPVEAPRIAAPIPAV